MQDNYKFGTKAIHAGADADPTTGAIMTPIFQTSTYVQESPGLNKGYGYARGKNPTREALQKNIAQARGRSMSLAEGDQLRGNRQSILAGKLGGDPKAIGAELKRVTDEIKKSGPTSDLMTKQKKLFTVKIQ
jgi:hypothetical protein